MKNLQSKEIAEELNKIIILQERRDNRLESKINLALEIQTEMLKDIRKIKIEQKEYDYRISKLEYEQKNTQEKLEKVGWYILYINFFNKFILYKMEKIW